MESQGNSAHIAGIIPARWDSSRFPGKPLHLLAGKPLLQHVYERATLCEQLVDIIIATDDERIEQAAKSWGAKVVMTSASHPTGTDRLAEAVKSLPDATHVINIQGDEPLIDPALVDQLAQQLAIDPMLQMITAANPTSEEEHIQDPNVVKVVLSESGKALYFSRSPIPFRRKTSDELTIYRHMGLYGYRRDFLTQFVKWPPSPLETAEQLEQLRALEHDVDIQVVVTDHQSLGLDTPEQAPEIEQLLLQRQTDLLSPKS